GHVTTTLPIGQVTVSVVDPDTGETHSPTNTLTPDATLTFDIDLVRPVATVSGTVTNDGVTPLPGAVVSVDGSTTTVADAAGPFAFVDLPSGPHTLSATFRGVSGYMYFDLSSNTVVNLQVPILILTGHVLEADGTPVPGVPVQAYTYGYTTSVTG